MRRRLAIVALLAALATAALAACGEEETLEVVEGEPLEVDELSYNVQITRFLNPQDVEDSGYLVDQPTPDPGSSYLGVFLTIKNESDDEALPSSDSYVVVDTLENEFEPVSSESLYALDIGATVPADDQLPIADSTAETGPIQGSMLLFLVDDTVGENRPLELEIGTPEGTGRVELDI